MENFSIDISLPVDEDGFVLLKCHNCNKQFMLKPGDMDDERISDICCPSCGMISDNYLTDDVIEDVLNILFDDIQIVRKELSDEAEEPILLKNCSMNTSHIRKILMMT